MEFFQQSRQYLGDMPMNLLRLAAWLGLLMVVFIPLERKWGRRGGPVLRDGYRTDLAYYFISSVVPKVFLSIPLSAIAAGLHVLVPSAYYSWVGEMPFWSRAAAALVIGDIGSYWGHRWSHTVPFLWRFHAVHHSAEEVDWLVNTRAHPIDLLFVRLCGLIPMYVLGLAQPMGAKFDLVPILVTIIGTFWGFFIHADLRWRFGWLEYVIATPAFHHWHHNNDAPELTDKNYAATLPWIDKLFGTLYLPREQWPARYGTDTAVGEDLTDQLINPFYPPARPLERDV